jgi:hypothetical protein
MAQFSKETMDRPSEESALSLVLRLIRLVLEFLCALLEAENKRRSGNHLVVAGRGRQEPSTSEEQRVKDVLLEGNLNELDLNEGPVGSSAIPTFQKQLYRVSVLGSRTWEMQPHRYYAVAIGRRPGIYTS